eukprot:SM000164S02284  [mRNA]  locus=s164:321624:323860:- [translate_table: standard]
MSTCSAGEKATISHSAALPSQLDAKNRAAAREHRASRQAERRRRQVAANGNSGSGGGSGGRVEGESSSEEEEGEGAAYDAGRADVLTAADNVFKDAAEEFASLGRVKERLEDWKSRYPSAYRDAYCSLSAPALLAPYVRLELLRWDPLFADAGFDSMPWYNLLFDYGMPRDGAPPDPADADSELVPRLVESVALPAVIAGVQRCWDPLSAASTRRAISAVQEVLVYVPPTSDGAAELLALVRARLTEAVAKMEVPAWAPSVLAAVPRAAAYAAGRFGAAMRLLGNLALWREVLPEAALEPLALDGLLAAQLLPHLRTLIPRLADAAARTERAVAALRGTLASLGSSARTKVAPLAEYVLVLFRSLEGRLAAGATGAEEAAALARRLKCMLVELEDFDGARHINKMFDLKEAV